MTTPPTKISLKECGLTWDLDLNLFWSKGVTSHSLGCWFPSSRRVIISRAVTTTRAVIGQGAQGGPGCLILSTITGQKALGKIQKQLVPPGVTLGADDPGEFPTD